MYPASRPKPVVQGDYPPLPSDAEIEAQWKDRCDFIQRVVDADRKQRPLDRMAYEGCREDLADWKRRALEYEAWKREHERLIEWAKQEYNGATHMGEPVRAAESREALDAGRAQRAQETNPWRVAVDQACISAGLDCTTPESNPQQVIAKLVDWVKTIALDPLVSNEAMALVERGAQRAQEDARDAARLDWLERRNVVVSNPRRYGNSSPLLFATLALEEERTDLRQQIDALRATTALWDDAARVAQGEDQ